MHVWAGAGGQIETFCCDSQNDCNKALTTSIISELPEDTESGNKNGPVIHTCYIDVQ